VRPARRAWIWICLAAALPLAGGDASADEPRLAFGRVALTAPGEQPVSLDADADVLAVGGLRSIWLGGPERLRRVPVRGPVVDVALLPGGALLAGTLSGLYRIEPGREPVGVAVGAGEASRDVRRIAQLGDLLAVATRSGVHLRRAGGAWRRAAEFPLGEATLAVLDVEGDTEVLWASVVAGLWRARLDPSGDELVSAERVRIPFAPQGAAPLDVYARSGAIVVAYPGGVWAVRDAVGSDWRVVRPVLPPGAQVRRLVRAVGRWWLATSAGLLQAAALEGPWSRAPDPVGGLPALSLAAGREAVFVATRQGVFVGRVSLPARGASLAVSPPAAGPSIDDVHRAVLAHVDLGRAPLRDMRRRVRRRGWLPVVSVRAGHDEGRSRRRDYDQSYVSGDTRDLYDYERDDDRELELSLTLAWDLGDAAYHPEEVDISREARAVIELRDDVLDEVTQLYYERRRVLAERAALGPRDPAAFALALRADELAAGIDAWTGGWFGRRVNCAAGRGVSPGSREAPLAASDRAASPCGR
jgi:hypothetical protein